MKIITANLNGIRAAAKKGFFKWAAKQDSEVICLQETKAQREQLTHEHDLQGYHAYFCDAEKKGYSGVAIYTRKKPDEVVTKLGWEIADTEGRYIAITFHDLNLKIASLYLPSGTSGEERQGIKFDFLKRYEKLLKQQLTEKYEWIICGDWNIAHKNIDLKNWRSNQDHSGFLPEERAWLDKVFDQLGYVDAFRAINQKPDQYTWWSHRGQARAKNVGWRIDYQVVTPGLRKTIQSADIYTKENFSDHAPLAMEYVLL